MLVERVLTFWFGKELRDGFPLECQDGFPRDSRVDLWFRATPQHDWDVARRFSRDIHDALAGRLEELAQTPRGRLALIILLGQFPRHIFRHTAKAFAGDDAALRHCKEGMAAKQDRELDASERLFFYTPLEHSEVLSDQRFAVSNIEALLAEVPEPVARRLAYFVHWIGVHRDVVEQFGRFSWRNRVLGRTSTKEERAYLEAEPPYFGVW